MEDTRNLPQNLIRKLFPLIECIQTLEHFRLSYRPIFEDDPAIASLLEHLHAERESVMARLRQYPNYLDYVNKYWEEKENEV